jgi:hypothetical protein
MNQEEQIEYPNPMKDLLQNIFEESVNIFLAKEAENIVNGIAERNLCGRLAIYLTHKLEENGINDYYADTEYNRKQDGKLKTILNKHLEVVTIQCDLIVHSRGKNIKQDNLIAIEMKKSTRPKAEKDNDRNRLMALTKDSYDKVWSYDGKTLPEHVCGYIIGVYMILDIAHRICYFEFYQKGNRVGETTRTF